MHPVAIDILFALQCFHVLFLALHDWIPLGTLNDVKAVRAENSGHKVLMATLTSTVPYIVGLVASALHFGSVYPKWLMGWLWISYAFLFSGELEAWWIPYLFGAKPERVARYEVMFGGTLAFLPVRNGIRINTLHVILHVATVAVLIVLGVLALRSDEQADGWAIHHGFIVMSGVARGASPWADISRAVGPKDQELSLRGSAFVAAHPCAKNAHEWGTRRHL